MYFFVLIFVVVVFVFDIPPTAKVIWRRGVNPYPATIFVVPVDVVCCIYSNAPQNTFTMEANTMNPDQTAP